MPYERCKLFLLSGEQNYRQTWLSIESALPSAAKTIVFNLLDLWSELKSRKMLTSVLKFSLGRRAFVLAEYVSKKKKKQWQYRESPSKFICNRFFLSIWVTIQVRANSTVAHALSTEPDDDVVHLLSLPPELIERILLHLSAKDLCSLSLCSTVCWTHTNNGKLWYATMAI